MRKSTQVGEDADGVATFRSSSVDKHKYSLRPITDLQSTGRVTRPPPVPFTRANFSSQPPRLSPQFFQARERSISSSSIPSDRSSSSSGPMTERQVYPNKYYYPNPELQHQ